MGWVEIRIYYILVLRQKIRKEFKPKSQFCISDLTPFFECFNILIKGRNLLSGTSIFVNHLMLVSIRYPLILLAWTIDLRLAQVVICEKNKCSSYSIIIIPTLGNNITFQGLKVSYYKCEYKFSRQASWAIVKTP